MPAADAIAALRAAGHCVTRTTRADAARRYGCQTALYVVDGRGVNLGRLRELATLAQAEPAPTVSATDVARLGFATLNPDTEGWAEDLPAECYPPAAPEPVARLQARGAAVNPVSVLCELNRPVLPGEIEPPAAPAPHGAAAPTLPTLRADAAAGRPVSLAALAAAITAERPAPTGEGLAGQPWDPGTPAARAAAALQGERAGILWPIRRALAGAGVALPPSWATDGPVMGGDLTLTDALARLPLGAIAQAAAALAALPPVTAAQDAALALCRTGAVPGRPYL